MSTKLASIIFIYISKPSKVPIIITTMKTTQVTHRQTVYISVSELRRIFLGGNGIHVKTTKWLRTCHSFIGTPGKQSSAEGSFCRLGSPWDVTEEDLCCVGHSSVQAGGSGPPRRSSSSSSSPELTSASLSPAGRSPLYMSLLTGQGTQPDYYLPQKYRGESYITTKFVLNP